MKYLLLFLFTLCIAAVGCSQLPSEANGGKTPPPGFQIHKSANGPCYRWSSDGIVDHRRGSQLVFETEQEAIIAAWKYYMLYGNWQVVNDGSPQ